LAVRRKPTPLQFRPQIQVEKAALLILFWILFGTAGFTVIEDWPMFDSFFMTITTISTVGYGETHPLSLYGRLFASVLIIGSIGTGIYAFTRLGQLVVEGELLGVLGKRKMMTQISRLQKHYIVCGYGRVGEVVCDGLEEAGVPFCVIDSDPTLEEVFKHRGFLYLIGDAGDEETLITGRIQQARALLALLSSDADNLYLSITAKSISPSTLVIARASDEKAEIKMKRGGADKVVSPYKMAGLRVLQAAIKPAALEFIDLVSHSQHLALSLEETAVAPGSLLSGLSLARAEVRKRYGTIIVAIKRASGEMVFNPGGEQTIQAGDTLVTIGKAEDLRRMAMDCRASA
jgi:voltage-gated potassium channel